jgi:uncharacterized membrane protein
MSQRGKSAAKTTRNSVRAVVAGLAFLVLAIVFFAVGIPAVGAVCLVLMVVSGVVGLVEMRRAAKEIKSWSSSVDDRQSDGLR